MARPDNFVRMFSLKITNIRGTLRNYRNKKMFIIFEREEF